MAKVSFAFANEVITIELDGPVADLFRSLNTENEDNLLNFIENLTFVTFLREFFVKPLFFF